MAFCAKCGKMLPDSSAFCGNCGAKNPSFVEAVTEKATEETATNVAEEVAEAIEEAVTTEATEPTEATEIAESAESTEESEAVEETAEEAVPTEPAAEFVPEPVKVEFEAPVEKPKKKGSAWWLVLGLFFPIVGLILFLVWRKKNPKSAKFVGIGAIIGAVLELISYIILFFAIIIFIFIMDAPEYSSPDMFGQLGNIVLSLIYR